MKGKYEKVPAQADGLMDPAAAWPAFTVVALVAGVGLGSCLVRG